MSDSSNNNKIVENMKRFIFAIFTAEQAGAILDSLCSKTERESEKDKLSADVGGFLTGDRAMSDKPDTGQSPVRN